MTSFPSSYSEVSTEDTLNLWSFGIPGRGVTLNPADDFSDKGTLPCVLITTGAVNPAHFGHVDIMHKASMHMQAKGFKVLHSYISPSHDDYVSSKARSKKMTYASAQHRCALLDLCIQDYAPTEAISTSRWESGQSHFVDYMDVAAALLRDLRKYYQHIPGVQNITVYYVCGEDHARNCFLTRGLPDSHLGVVVIPRVYSTSGSGSSPLEDNPARRVFIVPVRASNSAYCDFSSTRLRGILASCSDPAQEVLDSSSTEQEVAAVAMFGESCLGYCREQGLYVPPPVGLRIVHLSDTHNFLEDETSLHLPEGDILVHSGDFSCKGTVDEFRQFERWLSSIAHKFRYRIVIFGNHDVKVFRYDFEYMSSLLPSATHILNSESVTICGLQFHGRHWLHCYDSKYKLKHGFDSSAADVPAHNFHDIPVDTDVLLTHGPSLNLHDFYDFTVHSGSRELTDAIDSVERPVLVHLHGHIHESYGHSVTATASGVRLITSNASICDHYTTMMANRPRTICFPLRMFPHGTEPNLYDPYRIYVHTSSEPPGPVSL
jgi:Icc-related predicted phosphoesterase/phosphopantetheine adenylyltransferase